MTNTGKNSDKRMKRRAVQFSWFCLTVLCVAMLLFQGCSGKDGEGDSDEMVLRWWLRTKIQTLDAGDMRGLYSMRVGRQMYETLYTYHYLKRPYEAIPLLAEALPEISEDRLTYIIRIKNGIYYQDDPCFPDGKGRELKARDFVFSLKRVANVKYNSQNWASMKGKIAGLDDFREYTKPFKNEFEVDYSKEVEGLKALDDYTLQIKLTKPWPQIIDMILTDTLSSPVPMEAVDYYQKDIIYHPVGTGPYKLKKWQRGVYIELVRNENWRGGLYPSEGAPGDTEAGLLADAGKPVPFADRIIWRVILEDQPGWLLFMRGEFDGIGIPKDNFNEAVGRSGMEETEAMRQRGIRMIRYNDPSVFWLGFNMKDPVLGKNKPLRKAISRGYDRVKMNDILYNGRNQIAYGFIPPGLNSYDPEIEKYGFSKYDPKEAKALIKEAEQIQGGPIPPLRLAMPGTDTFYRQFGQFTQRQFERIGLTLEVDYMDWPTYMDIINKGRAQIFASGIGAGSPDAIDFLGAFSTREFAPGQNKFFYSNPAYDALYEKVEVLPFDENVKEEYRKLERMALEDYPAVLTTHRMGYVLIHDWLENYKPHIFSNNPFGQNKYYKIDVQKRNAYKDLLKAIKDEKKDE